jgi:hypothetical protein
MGTLALALLALFAQSLRIGVECHTVVHQILTDRQFAGRCGQAYPRSSPASLVSQSRAEQTEHDCPLCQASTRAPALFATLIILPSCASLTTALPCWFELRISQTVSCVLPPGRGPPLIQA